jgi:ABC-type branched-subunit amino acid transport system substrate-binding protein
MVEKLGVKSVYMVDEQTSYAAGLLAEVEGTLQELGVTEIQRASITQEEMDFSSLATRIVAAQPDAVFFPSQVANQMANLISQLRTQGYEGHYFLGDGGFDTSWAKAAGEVAEGAYVSFFAPDPRFISQAQPYIDLYTEKYGETYGAFGGAAALSTQIVLEALERCHQAENLNRACLIEELEATDMPESLLGIPVSFGTGNQLEGGEFFIFQVKQGEFVLVK